MSKKPSDATLFRTEKRVSADLRRRIDALKGDLDAARIRLGQAEARWSECRAERDSWKEIATNLSRAVRDGKIQPASDAGEVRP